MPRQLAQRSLAPPTRMSGPSAEFWEKLYIQDDALTRMDTEPYKAWLRVMFRGIAWLGYNRLTSADPVFRENKREYFESWCT